MALFVWEWHLRPRRRGAEGCSRGPRSVSFSTVYSKPSPDLKPVDASGNRARPDRRTFLAGVATGGAIVGTGGWLLRDGIAPASAGAASSASVDFSSLKTPGPMSERFYRWFDRHAVVSEGTAKGLIWNFYEPSRKLGTWVYPMLSAKAVLWFIKRGDVNRARVFAEALLPWQQMKQDGPLARSYGAFPSKLEQSGDVFTAGTAYYAGDNLVVVEALSRLYQLTKDFRYLNAAIGTGSWLVEVMSQGHKYGVWSEDLGAPMFLVTAKGDFVNHVHCQVEALWIRSLELLGGLTGEAAYTRQAAKAYEFYRKGQLPSGAYWDHYDPGYPPKPYNASNWKPYSPGKVISDNVLRAALGACRMDDIDSARKFYSWLKPENGAVPAYLNVESGSSGFVTVDDIYYDVVSCGLLRSLQQWLGKSAATKIPIQYLKNVQAKDGGWYWGWKREAGEPVTKEQAAIVGMWATADLSSYS